MRVLFVLFCIKILELSRFNLTNQDVSRSFYNLLSLVLLTTYLCFALFSRSTLSFEKKLELGFQKRAKGWIHLLDAGVLVGVMGFAYKSVGILYTHPVRWLTGDMLPMLRAAGENFLSGTNPFIQTYLFSEVPYTYLPMTLVYYLPSVWAKFDVRFISLLFFCALVLLIYHYYRKNGFAITGFLVAVIFLTSGLFSFLLISIHTFPYLFVLAGFLYALSEDKQEIMFFLLALAVASRRAFWPFLPFVFIYLFKERMLNLRNLGSFICGFFVGILPFLLHPYPFFNQTINNMNRQAQEYHKIKESYAVVHSLGFSHYLSGYRLETLLAALVVVGILVVLALKYLKKSNLWLFLSGILLLMTSIQSQTRAQEYYFLPLLVIVLFIPLETLTAPKLKLHFRAVFAGSLICVLALALTYPLRSVNAFEINPIRGHRMVLSQGLTYRGFAEVGLGMNIFDRKDLDLSFLITRLDHSVEKPSRLTIRINDKLCVSECFTAQKIQLHLEKDKLDAYLNVGGNDLEIELLPHEPFSLKIR